MASKRSARTIASMARSTGTARIATQGSCSVLKEGAVTEDDVGTLEIRNLEFMHGKLPKPYNTYPFLTTVSTHARALITAWLQGTGNLYRTHLLYYIF